MSKLISPFAILLPAQWQQLSVTLMKLWGKGIYKKYLYGSGLIICLLQPLAGHTTEMIIWMAL